MTQAAAMVEAAAIAPHISAASTQRDGIVEWRLGLVGTFHQLGASGLVRFQARGLVSIRNPASLEKTPDDNQFLRLAEPRFWSTESARGAIPVAGAKDAQ